MFSVRSAGLAAVVVGLLGTIGTVALLDGESKGLAVVEVLKFFLFTCGVGGISILYREIKKEREETERLISTRMKFRNDILAASRNVRLARRMLRTITTSVDGKIRIRRADHWLKLVEQLNAAHLEVESLRRILQANQKILGTSQSDITSHLRTVDHYIRDVLLEIEEAEVTDEANFAIGSTEALSEFLFSPTKPIYIDAFAAIDSCMLGEHFA